jgi:hypothetical protein
MMWRGRVGGKGEGHYGKWERSAGGWGDATSTQCALSPSPMLQHPTFP